MENRRRNVARRPLRERVQDRKDEKMYNQNATSSDYRVEHEQLLDDWATREHHIGKGCHKDGVFDLDRFAAAPRKILFLLKEAYSEGRGYDMRRQIRSPVGLGTTWWNTVCWGFALQHAGRGQMPPYPAFYENGDNEKAAEVLVSTAVINIKKSAGEHTTTYQDAYKYAQWDGDLLRRQVALIAADIVVCGGTWWAVKYLWPEAEKISERAYKTPGVTFLDFWHPAARKRKLFMYDELCQLAQRALFGGDNPSV
jgi:hypothetical protein